MNDSKTTSERIIAIDALRGFNMFWILGADILVTSLKGLWNNPATRFLAVQVDHSDWSGFTFYDFIFPLFIFIVGLSAALSLPKSLERSGRSATILRIIRRSLLLYVLGFIYYGGFAKLWPEVRLLGVLQRIAICYLVAGILFCFFRARGLAAVAAVILLGYWAALALVPFPDLRPAGITEICRETGFADSSKLNFASTSMLRGVYLKGVNLANYIDQRFLPGFKWDGSWDPEGLASTPAAIVTCLAGVLAGLFLVDGKRTGAKKAVTLALAGAAAFAVGLVWNIPLPIIKKIWTPSYVLVAAGFSLMLLAGFYYLVELRGMRRWTIPFVWIGMNPITVYLFDTIVDFHKLADTIAGGSVRNLFESVTPGLGDFIRAVLALALAVMFCRFLYVKKIFLKL